MGGMIVPSWFCYFPLLCPSITVLWYICLLDVNEVVCFLGNILTSFLQFLNTPWNLAD